MNEKTTVSKSGNRQHERIQLPLHVKFKDIDNEILAEDWSIGGFGLGERGVKVEQNSIHRVQLSFEFPSFQTSFEVNAKAVRVIDGIAAGFRFIDMDTDTVNLLRQVCDSHLSGDIVSIETVTGIESKDGVIQLNPKTVLMAKKIVAMSRWAAMIGAGCGVIALAVVAIISTFFTVTADHAAVSSVKRVVRAPVDGVIHNGVFDQGQIFSRKDVAFSIMSPEANPGNLAVKKAELDVSLSRIKNLEIKYGRAKEALERFSMGQKSVVNGSWAAVLAAKAHLKASTEQWHRYEALLPAGTVSVRAWEVAKSEYEAAKAGLREAEAKHAVNVQTLKDAKAGIWPQGNKSMDEDPQSIMGDIEEARSLAKLAEAEILALDTPVPALSPCDCHIEKILMEDGETVERGDQVIILGDRKDGMIDALITRSQARLIAKGDAASVEFSHNGETVEAIIQEINYDADPERRNGLPVDMRTWGRFALVTLKTEKAVELPVGSPASVAIRIGLDSIIHRMTGFNIQD